jgi:hypothetical protein
MGIRSWFKSPAGTHPSDENVPSDESTWSEPIKLSGTTTTGAHGAASVFSAHGLSDGGVLELAGSLVPEPSNPVDPRAVAVHVENEHIGYLPGYLSSRLQLASDGLVTCRVQLWAEVDRDRLRVIGWAAPGRGTVMWPHSPDNPPAITATDQRIERAAQTRSMVSGALTDEDNPERVEAFRRGMVGSLHFLETVEPIRQFKREGRLDEAITLCYGAIEAAEKSRDGREPPPWYTEQAAIIHRKRGEREQEIAVLQRWLDLCPEDRRGSSKIQQRLDRLLGSSP